MNKAAYFLLCLGLAFPFSIPAQEAVLADEVVAAEAATEKLPEAPVEVKELPQAEPEIDPSLLEPFAEYEKEAQAYLDSLKADFDKEELKWKQMHGELIKYKDSSRFQTPSLLKEAYSSINLVWRNLVDEVFALVEKSSRPDLPEPLEPDLDDELLSKEQEKQLALQLKKNKVLFKQVERLHSELLGKQKENLYDLLLDTGKIRARYYNRLFDVGLSDAFSFDEDYLQDLIREIKIVPYRAVAFVFTKGSEARLKLTSGISGWLSLLQQLGIFALVLAIPFVLFIFLRKLTLYLTKLRSLLFTKSNLSYSVRSTIAAEISRITPYLPWVLMMLATYAIGELLDQTDVSELGVILPYLRLYFGYRLFRLFAASIFSSLGVRNRLQRLQANKLKAQTSARRIGLIVLVELFILSITEDIVRRAIAYSLVSDLIFYINIVVFGLEFQKWKQEIDELSSRILMPQLSQFLNRVDGPWLKYLVTPIKALCLLGAKLILISLEWLGRFDLFKRLSSEILRKRLEDAVVPMPRAPLESALPPEYLKWMKAQEPAGDEFFVSSKRNDLSQPLNILKAWAAEQILEDSFILYGEGGSGKTTAIHALERGLGEIASCYLPVPAKCNSAKELLELLGQALKADIGSIDELMVWDANMPKTVIFLDDVQNLFLNQLSGFEAYRQLIDLINLQTQNIFWFVSMNQKSWRFLQGVFGPDHLALHELRLKAWSDEEIQQLILHRHQKSGFNMEFDSVIRAVRRDSDLIDEDEEIESQFFRLLWAQSGGNPRATLMLWLSSLRLSGERRVFVGIPEFSRSSDFAAISDEMLFVYAAIFRHGNLSDDEVHRVTNLPESNVKKALKTGEDTGALTKGPHNRYRISAKKQNMLNNLLIEKNFLYE